MEKIDANMYGAVVIGNNCREVSEYMGFGFGTSIFVEKQITTG